MRIATTMSGAHAARRKRAARDESPRLRGLARFAALAHVLVAAAISIAVCACVLLLAG